MKMNSNKFIGITGQILSQHHEALADAYAQSNAGLKSAFVLHVDEKVVTGKANAEWHLISEKLNPSSYNGIPQHIKEKIENNLKETLVIFLGWGGHIAYWTIKR
jgi:hypothetical protein